VRITAQLVDALEGHHLWAERYDRELTDVFAIQDEIALNVVSALNVVLREGEQARMVGSGPRNVKAWELHLQAQAVKSRYTKEGNTKARELWQQALALDPDYVTAWVLVGWTHWIDVRFGFSDSREDSLRAADEAVERALAVDDTEPDAYGLLGNIHLIKGEHDKAIAMGEKALALNPNDADNAAQLAMVMFFSGRPEEALELIRRAMRLDPNYPNWFLMPMEEAYRLTGRYEEAIETAKEYLRRLDHFFTRTRLALYYAQSGRDEEARAEIERVLQAKPDMNLRYWANAQFFKDPAQTEHDLADLRRVGLPD
jgi:adenylate cyclase